MSLQIRRLSHALGAEVIGVDISKPLDDKTFKEIHSAFLEHQVLVFRGYPFTREQHAAFSRRFGELFTYGNKTLDKQSPDNPEIYLVISKPKPNGEAATGRYTGADWHSDYSHLPAAALASLLHCVEVPEVGGDTMFCNMYRAYDSLSDGMKKLLEGLHGVHMEGSEYSKFERQAKPRELVVSTAHPIVRVHPETNRKALYVNKQVRVLVGMTPDESKPLVDYLTEAATRPQNVYRHQWQKEDLVMWDNRCLLHMALGDFDRTKVRHMERTTVVGNRSGHAYDGPLN